MFPARGPAGEHSHPTAAAEPDDYPAWVIVEAVVCPGAPLLIPGLSDGLRAQVPDVVDACDRAVGLLGTVDRVLLVHSGPRARDGGSRVKQVSVVHHGGAAVSSALITGASGPTHFTGRLPGTSLPGRSIAAAPEGALPGVGTVVGAALLARAGIEAPVTAVDLADRSAEVAALLREAQLSTDRVGVLVMGEGSASRGVTSPGGGAAGAEVLDASLAAALAAGDPVALGVAAALDPVSAERLLFTAGPALLALTELTASRPPQRAELLLDQAPLGVGYLVATWSWAG